jgi:hypothetical protein
VLVVNNSSFHCLPRIEAFLGWLAAATLLLAFGCRGPDQPSAAAAGDSVQQTAMDTAGLPRTNVTIADRARWLARLHWPRDCEGAYTQTHLTDDGGLDFQEVEPGLSIVVVRCALGAYQPSQVVLQIDARLAPEAVTVFDFASFESSDGKSLTPVRVAELTGEITLLGGGRTLTVLSLARQIGDCGTWARYRLGEGAPRLEVFAERVACPEVPGERADPEPGMPPVGWKRITPS